MNASAAAQSPLGDRRRLQQNVNAWLPALAVILCWQLLLAVVKPYAQGDECYHVPAIQALARGGPLPRALPMLPTYHWLMSQAARWCDARLGWLRVQEGAIAVAALLFYGGVLRGLYGEGSAHRLLLFVASPLVLPYLGLVYTDLAAAAAVVAALYLHLRARHVLAAVALLLAVLLRQSNVVWVAFMVAWRIMAGADLRELRAHTWHRNGAGALRVVWRERLWLHGLLLVAGAAYMLGGGKVVPVVMVENRAEFNVAQLYLFGLTLAVLWLPLWLPALVTWLRRGLPWLLLRPWKCAGVVLAAGLLVVAFRNPHEWNTCLDFLHNWPLWLMMKFAWWRVAGAVIIVAFVLAQGRLTWLSPARPTLILVWVCTLLFLLPHYLADVRYYIVPILLLDVFTPYAPATGRRLAVWYVVLAVGMGAFILSRPTCVGGQ